MSSSLSSWFVEHSPAKRLRERRAACTAQAQGRRSDGRALYVCGAGGAPPARRPSVAKRRPRLRPDRSSLSVSLLTYRFRSVGEDPADRGKTKQAARPSIEKEGKKSYQQCSNFCNRFRVLEGGTRKGGRTCSIGS